MDVQSHESTLCYFKPEEFPAVGEVKAEGETCNEYRSCVLFSAGTPGANFINILKAAFSYESVSLLTVCVCNFLLKGYVRKSCS